MSHRAAGAISMVAAAGIVLAGCGSSGDAAEASDTVNITMPNHTWTTAIQEKITEFEDESGLKVNITTYGEDQLSDQYNVKLNAGSSEIDVMMYRPLQEGKTFAENGWLAPLDDLITQNAEWDWEDFQPGPVEATTTNGTVYGVPVVTEREILYYRADLLQEAGIEVPETLDELQAAVEALHNPDEGVYGFVARGALAPSVTQFSSFLYSFGGDWDEDGEATIASDEAKAAYAYYSGLLREYGPPGTNNMSWPEAVAIFAQGKAAFYTDADSLYNNMTDPSKSTVQDKVGFAVFPAGPAGSKPYNVPPWALGINEFSGNKDNAWEFIEWATSKENTLAIQAAGVPSARQSAWESPEGISGFPEQLAEVILASGEIGVGYDRPRVIQVSKARDIVGRPVVTGIGGGDVEAAADQAQSEYQAFLDNENG